MLPVARAASWSPARSQNGLHNIYSGTAGCGGKGLGLPPLAACAFGRGAGGAGASLKSPWEPFLGPECWVLLGGTQAQTGCHAYREIGWMEWVGDRFLSLPPTSPAGWELMAARRRELPSRLIALSVSYKNVLVIY